MKRNVFVALMLVAAVSALFPAYAGTLPTEGQVIGGQATIVTSGDLLTVDQTSDRSVIRWDTFDIGQQAKVNFTQPSSEAATLNIVGGTQSTTLAGQLTATGSVYLINPHGITITPDGSVDTGGAFIASTLSAVDAAAFMNGSDHFIFQAEDGSGNVLNEGHINARDVVLLGSRVNNDGIITARLGRVALGSASRATLDLSGDGFLQVLLPATVDGEEALLTNSGTITADGGLVQITAATAYDAMREAVNMPGEVRARSVSGRDGAIVFGGGDGGTLTIDGIVDASADSDQGGNGGGSVELTGRRVDLDFNDMHLGAGGHFYLAADAIAITQDGYTAPDATRIIENIDNSSIGDLLRAGTNVTLHANKDLYWADAFLDIIPEEGRQAGNLHLLAAGSLSLSGAFSTNGDWTLTANAKPVIQHGLADNRAEIHLSAAQFVRNNGHLTLEILAGDESAGRLVSGIELPAYSGEALTAKIDPRAVFSDDPDILAEPDIIIRNDIGVSGDITLSGHLRTIRQDGGGEGDEGGVVTSLSGRRVTWITEKTNRLAGGLLRFVENGVVTRFGRGGIGVTEPGVDAIRLELGSESAFIRLYGDADPDQSALEDLILTIAPHNKLAPGEGAVDYFGGPLAGIPTEGIPLSEILAAGSISVRGPGVRAETNSVSGTNYYLILEATDQLALKPLVIQQPGDGEPGDPTYVSGAAGGYWIDLSGANDLESRVPLVIEPRPLTVEMMNASYTYGSPVSLLTFTGLVNDDDIRPVGILDETTVTFTSLGIGFGLDPRTNVGDYTYTVTGITGERAGNYALDVTGLPVGSLSIIPRLLSYEVISGERTYGSMLLPSVSLTGVLSGDDVTAVSGLYTSEGDVTNSERLQVGLYGVTVTGLDGTDARNYMLAGDGNYDGTLEVLAKALTWSVTNSSGVYGTMATLGTPSLHGVLDGDEVVGIVDVNLPGGAPLAFDTDAGRHTVSVVALAGADQGNYRLAASGNSPGSLYIGPKQLTLPTTMTWVYGDTSNGRQLGQFPAPPLIGVVGGDDVSLEWVYPFTITQVSGGSGGIDWGAGTYQVRAHPESVSDWDPLTGADKHNYVLPRSGIRLDVTITPRPLHFTVENLSSDYGTLATPNVTLEGVVEGDSVFGDIVLRQDNRRRELHARLPVGEYEMTVEGLSGHAASNYTLASTGNMSGTLRINPKLLEIGHIGTAVYGDELLFDGTTRDGVLHGDAVQLIVEAKLSDGTLSVRPGAGTYASVITGLLGEDAANYALPPLAERLDGVLTVTKRPLTVHVSNWFRTYGDHAQGVPARFDNLVSGDGLPLGLVYKVSKDPDGTFVPLTERTSVGTYWVRIAGLDDPNYTLAETGHGDGQVEIVPKPVRYTTFDVEAEYGQNNPYLGAAELNMADILEGDHVDAEGVVIRNRSLYPGVLPANNKYQLVPGGLRGLHKDNYVLEHVGSTQGFLTVTPKSISVQVALNYNGRPLETGYWTFGELESMHGFENPIDGGFTTDVRLFGVLAGDEVGLDVVKPTLEKSSQGYLAVGEYRWTLGGLTGFDSGNYVLADNTWTRWVEVLPRRVRLIVDANDLTYGDHFRNLDIRFEGEDNTFFRNSALDIANVVIRSTDGYEISVDELLYGPAVRLSAGAYFAQTAQPGDPFLVGPDAKNFDATLAGGFYVAPRQLTFLQPFRDYWVYGNRFSPGMLYDGVTGPDGAQGVLEEDDVSIEYWGTGRGISDNNKDARLDPASVYNPAGEYSGFTFRLFGADARNYELIQPDYTVTIRPRPLELPIDEFVFGDEPGGQFVITYGDDFDAVGGEFGDVLLDDMGRVTLAGPHKDGTLQRIHLLDAGRYQLGTLELVGTRAGNYVLEVPNPDYFLKIDQRELLYNIDDVVGQYGNFLPCLDPVTCNGGPRGEHGSNYLWVPGLTLGQIYLEGMLPGDEVEGGNITLIDANGRTGSLADMPPPGVYFQVLEELTGKDAHNYRIASTGSQPGILTMTPQWVRWQTHESILMPETGVLTWHPDKGLVSDFQPILKSATNEHDLSAAFEFVRVINWEEQGAADFRRLEQGNYYVDVVGFTGSLGSFYRPLPPEQSDRGILSVFVDSTLGLDFVGGVENPLAGLRDMIDAADLDHPVPAPPRSGEGAPFSFGDGFGHDIDLTFVEDANLRAGAYADVLASYGVTGVSLKAGAGVEVQYQIGQGYVEVGAGASARARAGVSLSGIGASGAARAGAYAGGGIEGDLGGGVHGGVSGRTGVVAVAEGKTGLSYADGKFTMGSKAHVGAGAMAGVSGGISGEAGSVDTGVTVYTPGTIGGNINIGAGFRDGHLSVEMTLGAALGIAGLEFDLGFSLNVGAIGDAFESIVCGITSCPPSVYEMGRDQLLRAQSIHDPVARLEYLSQNPEWMYVPSQIAEGKDVPEAVRRAYDESAVFFNQFAKTIADLEQYVESNQSKQDYFFRNLQDDPFSAFSTAQSIIRSQENPWSRDAALANAIQESMNELGVRLVVKGGQLSFEGL